MKSTRRHVSMALVLAAVTALAAPARAGEGRIPLYQPAVITAPGSYVVTRDIMAMSGPIFDIQADGVSLNLNGHTLSLSNDTDPVIQISAVMGIDPEPIRIANGAIVGGMHGIHALDAVAKTLLLSDLGIIGAADAAVKVDHVGDFQAKGIVVVDTKTAFDVTGPSPTPGGARPSAMIRDSMIHADIGISCTGVKCAVNDNSVASCGSGLRLMGAQDSEATGNSFSLPGSDVCFNPQPEPPGDSIHLEGSPGVRVTGNTLRGSPSATGANHGITADATSHDALIADNQILGYGNDGMHLMSSNNLIRGNLINRNMGNGIWLSGNASLVDDNRIGANTGDGIVFNAADNIYRNNVLLGNANALSGIGLSDSIDGGGNIQ